MLKEPLGGVPTREEIEGRVLLIWTDILERTDIDVHDDFVSLGGDSLSAMLCVSRVRSAFAIQSTIEDFFIDPATVAGLAAIIHQRLPTDTVG